MAQYIDQPCMNGLDTQFRPCSYDHRESQFISKVCTLDGTNVDNTLYGSDNVWKDCTQPKANITYSSRPCFSGEISDEVACYESNFPCSTGQDTEISLCPEPSDNQFRIADCIAGTVYVTASNHNSHLFVNCSEPKWNEFVIEPCKFFQDVYI